MTSMIETIHHSGQAILGVGCAALDIVSEVASYPDEVVLAQGAGFGWRT